MLSTPNTTPISALGGIDMHKFSFNLRARQ